MSPAREREQIEPLRAWDEQVEYEETGPPVLFGGPVPEGSAQTGVSERVLYQDGRLP